MRDIPQHSNSHLVKTLQWSDIMCLKARLTCKCNKSTKMYSCTGYLSSLLPPNQQTALKLANEYGTKRMHVFWHALHLYLNKKNWNFIMYYCVMIPNSSLEKTQYELKQWQIAGELFFYVQSFFHMIYI